MLALRARVALFRALLGLDIRSNVSTPDGVDRFV
jgi:hypothetical protein